MNDLKYHMRRSSEIFAACGITPVFVHTKTAVDKQQRRLEITGVRDFEDVFHARRHVAMLVPKNTVEIPAETLVAIWHEVGHAVTSTETRKDGKHWLTDAEDAMRMSNTLSPPESAIIRTLCNDIENLASIASLVLLERVGGTQEQIRMLADETNILLCSGPTLKSQLELRNYGIYDVILPMVDALNL